MSFLEKSSKPSFRVVWRFFSFFLIQVNSKCKRAYFNIWYRWVVNADNSWRMSDQGVLALYQEDNFVLGMQNNTHYSSLWNLPSEGFPSSKCRHMIPSEMGKPEQLQLPHLHIRWDSTVTETPHPTLLLRALLHLPGCTFHKVTQVNAISGTVCLQAKL